MKSQSERDKQEKQFNVTLSGTRYGLAAPANTLRAGAWGRAKLLFRKVTYPSALVWSPGSDPNYYTSWEIAAVRCSAWATPSLCKTLGQVYHHTSCTPGWGAGHRAAACF